MADSAINIDEGSEQAIDTRTEGTNGNHRQVVVLGDPAVNDGVAPVDAIKGLAVDVKALPNEGQQTMANSISVAIASDQSSIPVSTTPAAPSATTGTITGNAQTISVDTTKASSLMFYVTGTFSNVNCAFEGSIDGGTNWFSVQAVRTNANTIETSTGNLSAAPAYGWKASVNGLTNFRVRSTAYTSGTQNWRFVPGVYATEPIPAAQVSDTQPVSGTVAATISAGATTIAKAEDTVHGDGDTGVPIWAVRTDTPASTSSATGDYDAIHTNALGQLQVSPYPTTNGGLLIQRILSAASTNATSIKASAGQVYTIYATNLNAAVRYLKLYNKASSPTVGTDTPVMTLPIPASTTGAGFVLDTGGMGITFSNGIAMAITTGVADSDTGAVAANEIVINLLYK
jgi:hypothetical protein